jgi:hypothetical protein
MIMSAADDPRPGLHLLRVRDYRRLSGFLLMNDEPVLSRLRVFRMRDESVLLDSDLAVLYGVETRVFNQTIKRNACRFPADFAFQITSEEFAALISQLVTSKPGRGGSCKLPWAFTEHGAIMGATILNSERAVARGARGGVERLCRPGLPLSAAN